MKNEDKNKSFVPAIRFKGFTEDWEQRKLGDIADVTKLAGFEFTEYVTYSDEGNIIAIRGLNVKNGSLNLDDVKYIDDSDFSKLERSKLYKDDILFTYVGTVGEVAIIQENNRFYLAPNVSRIRVKQVENYSGNFIIQQMESSEFYNKIIFPLIATSSQPALSMENIRKFVLKFPTHTEQPAIGNFFRTFDNIVTLHQRKLEILRKLKKYYLQTMFATGGDTMPCLRFSGYSGEWVGKKLNNCVKHIHTGLNPRDNFKLNNGGSFFYVTIKNIIHGRLSFENCDRIDGKALQLVQKRSDLQVNDVLFSSIGRIGDCYVITEPPKNWNINESVFSIRPLDNVIAPYYLVAVLKTKKIIDTLTNSTTGSTFKSIKKAQLLDLEISTPTLPEQAQIGDFFQHLDTLLERYERVINLLQKMKQFYLQKMFP